MFWLKVRKEYILENFEDLLSYLRGFNYDREKLNERGDFSDTIECMEELCADLGLRLSQEAVYRSLPSDIDGIKAARLMGATLLTQYKSGRDMKGTLTGLLNLVPFVSKALSSDTLSRLRSLALDVMAGHQPVDLKITWHDLERDNFKLPLFITRIASMTFSKKNDMSSVKGYEGKGCLRLTGNGVMSVFPGMNLAKVQESRTKMLCHAGNNIEMHVDSSEADVIESFEDIYKSFNLLLDLQERVQPSPKRVKRALVAGDEVKIRVTGIEKGYPLPKVKVQTVSPDHETVKGMLIVRTSDYNRPKAQDILSQINIGDVYIGVYTPMETGEPRFEVTKFFEAAYRRCAAEYTAKTVIAVLDHDYTGGCQLLTENGVRVGLENTYLNNLSEDDKDYFLRCLHVGDPVRVTFYYSEPPMNNEKFYMYCMPAYDPFVDKGIRFNRKDADGQMVAACLDEMAQEDMDDKQTGGVDEYIAPRESLVAIARLLWRETAVSYVEPIVRLTYLSIAAVLSRLAGAEEDVMALRLERRYLARLVDFASGRELAPLNVSERERSELAAALEYDAMVEALREYRRPESHVQLSTVASGGADTNLPARIKRVASLVNASNEIVDIVDDVQLDNIKRAIVRALDVDEEFVSMLSKSTHYGMENMTREFKKSIVFPPADRRRIASVAADYNYQKWAILKTVCGFLNSRAGGELILGVNDGGYAEGVESDIRQLFKDGIIAEPTLDRYRTLVQNLIDYTFSDATSPATVSSDITALNVSYIEETNAEGKQLLHIQVKPYPYGVVRFRPDPSRPADFKESYVRRSGSTMPLTPALEREILSYKQTDSTPGNAGIMTLRKALADKKMVRLKNYESSSGVADRDIEPYKVWPTRGMVYGYDISTRKGRVFKLSRCSEVEMLNKGWNSYRCAYNVSLDPFGFIIEDSKAIEIQLRLTNYAAQLLREEHPDANIVANTSATRNKYPYELRCKVSALEGITRFCLGLPNEYSIVKGTELEDAIRVKAQSFVNF